MRSLVLFCIALVLAGCNAANNSQYQTPARGGWDNFRAHAVDPGPVGRAT
jgi:hypothetical protein